MYSRLLSLHCPLFLPPFPLPPPHSFLSFPPSHSLLPTPTPSHSLSLPSPFPPIPSSSLPISPLPFHSLPLLLPFSHSFPFSHLPDLMCYCNQPGCTNNTCYGRDIRCETQVDIYYNGTAFKLHHLCVEVNFLTCVSRQNHDFHQSKSVSVLAALSHVSVAVSELATPSCVSVIFVSSFLVSPKACIYVCQLPIVCVCKLH